MRYGITIDRNGQEYAFTLDTLEAAEAAFVEQCRVPNTFSVQVWALDAEGNGEARIMNYAWAR